jgi:hypothetical protein
MRRLLCDGLETVVSKRFANTMKREYDGAKLALAMGFGDGVDFVPGRICICAWLCSIGDEKGYEILMVHAPRNSSSGRHKIYLGWSRFHKSL